MKSDAEIMPGTDADSLSHRGADARPWSCSAWNACDRAVTALERPVALNVTPGAGDILQHAARAAHWGRH